MHAGKLIRLYNGEHKNNSEHMDFKICKKIFSVKRNLYTHIVECVIVEVTFKSSSYSFHRDR